MGCLDADALADFFERRSGETRDAAERHVDGCAACRELVAAYARAMDDGPDDLDPSPRLDAAGPIERSDAPPPRAGDPIGERWVLERVIGEGGMAVVWAARDASGARVAIKILKDPSPELCRRFAREARVASAIAHPNVLEIRAVVPMRDGSPALVMDLLEGESLASLLARGPLEVDAVIGVLLPLVSAVRAAHAKGVIHRDLKPENVFLARDDEAREPVVMLLDFGLAKLVTLDGSAADKLTRSGALLGTPRYMAPEQLLGESSVDARADVWSIGAIAYEALSGVHALEGRSYGQILRSATRGAVRPLGEIAPRVPGRDPGALTALVDRMLAIDPAGRPALAEVHATLDAYRPTSI